jgi:DNA-binding NarL/FixJ family response regulator
MVSFKPSRLLLADRHLDLLRGVHRLLHELFETVVMVADEPSLRDAVTTFDPDTVVVDLSLPGGEEADLVGRLMEEHRGLRLVVLSVHDEPEVADRIMGAGAAGFVLKRAAATDLVPAVRAALGGGRYVSPAMGRTREARHASGSSEQRFLR